MPKWAIIPSGSIASTAYSHPWWVSPYVLDDEIIPFGTLALIKPTSHSIIRNEWAGEIVIVLEKLEGSIASAPLYRVISRHGTKIIPAIELRLVK